MYQQAVQELSLDTEIVTFGGGENSLAKFMDAQQNLPSEEFHLRKTALNLSTLHWASGSFNALLIPINHIKVQTSGPATTEHVIDVINRYKLISPDTRKEILEPNVTGELLLKGPVMAGYYNDPAVTKAVFTDDGFIKTGDLFYKDENGLFFFVERHKMLLKYKNYQIVPPEVEEVILTHDGVADVCVTGIPDPFDGDHIVACVVRQQGSKVTAQEIKDLVSKHLSASKHLHGGVVFLDALPTTFSGKVGRNKVKKLVLTAHRE